VLGVPAGWQSYVASVTMSGGTPSSPAQHWAPANFPSNSSPIVRHRPKKQELPAVHGQIDARQTGLFHRSPTAHGRLACRRRVQRGRRKRFTSIWPAFQWWWTTKTVGFWSTAVSLAASRLDHLLTVAIDAGPLRAARYLEGMGLLTLHLAYSAGYGPRVSLGLDVAE
jgi:hypothetical protein